MEQALERAAAVMTAAFISRGGIAKPDDAAVLYFRCLDALKTAKSDREAGRRSAREGVTRMTHSVVMARKTGVKNKPRRRERAKAS
jgi:hypothetical protein